MGAPGPKGARSCSAGPRAPSLSKCEVGGTQSCPCGTAQDRVAPHGCWPWDGHRAQDPQNRTAPSYLLVRGCPRGRAPWCCARLPRLPRLRTAHVTLEETALGRKSKLRASRCRSTPHPRSPRGSSCPPAWPAPGLPQATSHRAVGVPAGAWRLPGLGAHLGRTEWAPHPRTASVASADGEGLGEDGAMAQPHRHRTLAPWSPPGRRVHPLEPFCSPHSLRAGAGAPRGCWGRALCGAGPARASSPRPLCAAGQASAPGTRLGVPLSLRALTPLRTQLMSPWMQPQTGPGRAAAPGLCRKGRTELMGSPQAPPSPWHWSLTRPWLQDGC